MTVSAHPEGRARGSVSCGSVWAIFRQEEVNLPTHPEDLRAALHGGSFSAGSIEETPESTYSFVAPSNIQRPIPSRLGMAASRRDLPPPGSFSASCRPLPPTKPIGV